MIKYYNVNVRISFLLNSFLAAFLKKVERTPTKLPVSFMKKTYKIIGSDEALNNLKDIIDYLENR